MKTCRKHELMHNIRIKTLHLTCSVVTLSYWIILLKFEQFSNDSEMLQFQHSPKANNGQTKCAIFFTEKLKQFISRPKGIISCWNFYLRSHVTSKLSKKMHFFVRNFTKLCENMRKFVNYAKTFKLCDFA